MIIECPSCRARYLVQIGLFAQGGRQVRCARCKHGWHAKLPTHIDVFVPPPVKTENADKADAAAPGSPPYNPHATGEPQAGAPVPNLPATIKKWRWKPNFKFNFNLRLDFMPKLKLKPKVEKYLRLAGRIVLMLLFIGGALILARERVVLLIPPVIGVYEAMGFVFLHTGQGLAFEDVKSELKYDGGTMRLIVDGVIHNTTDARQFIPDMTARARGADQSVIQSWGVGAPAPTVEAGGEIPFHTEVNAPMNQTIEDVYLEFQVQDENGNVVQ